MVVAWCRRCSRLALSDGRRARRWDSGRLRGLLWIPDAGAAALGGGPTGPPHTLRTAGRGRCWWRGGRGRPVSPLCHVDECLSPSCSGELTRQSAPWSWLRWFGLCSWTGRNLRTACRCWQRRRLWVPFPSWGAAMVLIMSLLERRGKPLFRPSGTGDGGVTASLPS